MPVYIVGIIVDRLKMLHLEPLVVFLIRICTINELFWCFFRLGQFEYNLEELRMVRAPRRENIIIGDEE